MAHQFGLGKIGRIFITSYQHLLRVYDLETQKTIDNYPNEWMGSSEPIQGQFSVCRENLPLIAVGEFHLWIQRI